jgi:hypothetical protein
MKHRIWIPSTSVVLLCVTCACCDGPTEECGTDLTAYLGDLERLCTGVFEGTIQDSPASGDAVYEPCAHDAETYRLEIETVSGMSCTGSEDQEGVDCTHADWGLVEIAGTLEIGADFELDVTGFARAGPWCSASGGILACAYWLPDDPVPRSAFEARPEEMNPDQEDLEMFFWSRRHSEEDEEPTVWEVCELSIETHE